MYYNVRVNKPANIVIILHIRKFLGNFHTFFNDYRTFQVYKLMDNGHLHPFYYQYNSGMAENGPNTSYGRCAG